ncbi:flavoprotein-like protein [Tricladium varicosporioides]|nr:flavoprotein-like protein [Hymenoscyphus varicosporioides]
MSTTLAPKKIALIIGSTRAVRVGPKVVDFIHSVLSPETTSSPTLELEIVDIAKYKLPVFDEVAMPAMVPFKAQFEHQHSKDWSAAMAPFSAYIWVSAEYNYGTPSGIKNAIDYLYNELGGKPAMVVTYGIHGGQMASKSLVATLEGMKMRVVETKPQLSFAGPTMDDMFMAAGTGALGEKTKNEWETGSKGPLLKGFAELVKKLDEAPEPEKKGE